LTPLFLSCEKEIMGEGSGKRLEVNVSVSAGDYSGDDAMRSSVANDPEAAVIDLGEDWFLFATLEPDPAALRATGAPGPLDPNQKIRIAAYPASGTPGTTNPASAVNYYLNGSGKLVPDPAGASLTVEEGVSYIFAAYSYKSASVYPPAGNALSNVNSTNYDLLWGSTTKAITSANRTVSINMKHQFAQLKVLVTSNTTWNSSITGIGAVGISSGWI
jgi:hypothetical protein